MLISSFLIFPLRQRGTNASPSNVFRTWDSQEGGAMLSAQAGVKGQEWHGAQSKFIDSLTFKEKKTQPATGAYARLLAAGQRLLAIIKKSEGYANKDLGKMTDQIIALCDKLEK